MLCKSFAILFGLDGCSLQHIQHTRYTDMMHFCIIFGFSSSRWLPRFSMFCLFCFIFDRFKWKSVLMVLHSGLATGPWYAAHKQYTAVSGCMMACRSIYCRLHASLRYFVGVLNFIIVSRVRVTALASSAVPMPWSCTSWPISNYADSKDQNIKQINKTKPKITRHTKIWNINKTLRRANRLRTLGARDRCRNDVHIRIHNIDIFFLCDHSHLQIAVKTSSKIAKPPWALCLPFLLPCISSSKWAILLMFRHEIELEE